MQQQANSSPDFRLRRSISDLVQEDRELGLRLAEMITWEETHQMEGWEASNVHCSDRKCRELISLGVLDQHSKSHKYTYYKLRSLSDTKAALTERDQEQRNVVRLQPATFDAADLFKLVIGHDRAKTILRYIIKASSEPPNKPVHAILHGPPGTAKTLMLEDIASLPGAELYVGSTTTKSGLVQLLLEVQPPILVIDEIDKMNPSDMTPLLNVMESGMITRLQHGHNERVELRTKVFAGANDLRRVSDPIQSRFAKIPIPGYSADEFVQVATQVLMVRHGLGPEMARLIAICVVPHSQDIRDAVRIATMARSEKRVVLPTGEVAIRQVVDPLAVDSIVAAFWPADDRRR